MARLHCIRLASRIHRLLADEGHVQFPTHLLPVLHLVKVGQVQEERRNAEENPQNHEPLLEIVGNLGLEIKQLSILGQRARS